MKETLLLLFIAFSLKGVAQVRGNWAADNGDNTYSNPMIYADYPDPDVIRVGDDFYMVATSHHFVPGAPILKSKDLVNWEMAGYAVERWTESSKYDLIGGALYLNGDRANTMAYRNGKFYVATCTPTHRGLPDSVAGEFNICVASDISGPWKRTAIKEYMDDPGLLFDDDGRFYVAHGQGAIKITELTADGQAVKTPTKKVFYNPKYPYLEGCHFYKINGMYYILTTSSGVKEVCLRSSNIYGPYESKEVLVDKTPIPKGWYPPHQGGMVQLKDGTWWFMIMQDRGPIGRSSNLEPVTWVDGWPMIGVNGKGVVTYQKPNIPGKFPITTVATSDEFNSTELGLQWQWNHNPDTLRYTLRERPGYMRLKANLAAELSVARNTLTQKVIGPNSTGTVLMDVRGMKDGQVAGFGVFQKPYGFIGVKQDGLVRRIIMNNNNKVIDSTSVFTGDSLWIRAKTSAVDSTVVFFYSTDGIGFKRLGNTMIMDLGYTWTANRFALISYCTRSSGIDGYVDFNWFHFTTDFYATKTNLIAGESTKFNTADICEKNYTYKWSFPGGIPSKSSLKKPVVKYRKPGVYDVKLVVKEGKNKDSFTRSGYISVRDTCYKKAVRF